MLGTPALAVGLAGLAVLVWPAPGRWRVGRWGVGRWRLGRGHVTGNAPITGRVGLIGLGATVGVMVAAVSSWCAAIAAAVLATTVTHLMRRGRRASRERVRLTTAAGSVRGVLRELRAGVDPDEAVDQVIAGAPPGVSHLWEPVRSDAAGAAGVTGAAGDARATTALQRRIAAAWSLARRHGIPLSTVLGALGTDLDSRVAAMDERSGQVAGPLVSGYVMAALPLAGLALGAGMGTNPWQVLTGSAIGGALLVIGVLLSCGGLLWADRIARGVGNV